MQIAHVALALKRHVRSQRDPVHMLQGLAAAQALVELAKNMPRPSENGKARSTTDELQSLGAVPLAALLRIITHCTRCAGGRPELAGVLHSAVTSAR